MKKFLCVILAIFLTFVCACDKSQQAGNPPERSEKLKVGILNSDTNHYWEVNETENYILQNSNTEYALLVPENYGVDLDTAVQEFNLFFSEATGVKLDVVKDTSCTDSGKYISLGQTKLLEENGLEADNNLKTNGFRIVTKGDNIFLFGNNELSVVYAVYDLMSHILNYDYFIDMYVIDKNVTEIPLFDYNVTEIPDIDNPAATYNVIAADKLHCYRARMFSFFNYFVGLNGVPFHNTLPCLPVEEYYEDHPKWYSASKTQLSYCAQGDEEEYQLMVETVAEKFKEELIAQPNKNYLAFTVMDDMEFDNSPAQQEITRTYGAESASIILFLNDVNAIIRDWFKSDEGKPYDRDLEILFFAYNRAEEAPVEWNEEKQCYEGVNGIKCDDGVSVFWAPINIDYMHSVYDSTNENYYELGKKWSAICDEIVFWTYTMFYPNYLVPYNNFNSMQDIFRYAKELDVSLMFNESEDSGESLPSCYGGVKAYLEQKLAWNTEVNVAELTDKYFDCYYGKLGDDMQKIFNSVLAYTTYLKDYKVGYDGVFSVQNAVMKEDLWNKQVLLGWYNQYSELIKKAQNIYASDKAMYDLVYKHIALERLSPAYILTQLYSINTKEDLLNELKYTLRDDTRLIGGQRCIANGAETDIEIVFDSWGI